MIQDILPSRLYNHYDPGRRPSEGSYILSFRGSSVLMRSGSGKASLLRMSDFAGSLEKAVYLLTLDSEDFFLLPDGHSSLAAAPDPRIKDPKFLQPDDDMMPEDEILPEDCAYVKVRDLRKMDLLPKPLVFAVNTARQIAAWYADNRFCGTCGSRTVHSRTERALCCPECGRTIYPRIQPAVIVGVTHNDELLLTRYSDRPLAYDALVAGFTEIGETFEQTVEREVMEETGLRVRNIRYYKSQPWAIADDILAGYYCDVDGDTTVHIDKSELKQAVWTKREDIAGQPDDYSLTNEMMITFKKGLEPR